MKKAENFNERTSIDLFRAYSYPTKYPFMRTTLQQPERVLHRTSKTTVKSSLEFNFPYGNIYFFKQLIEHDINRIYRAGNLHTSFFCTTYTISMESGVIISHITFVRCQTKCQLKTLPRKDIMISR